MADGGRNAHGWSPLYQAAFSRDVDEVRRLLGTGSDPDDDPPPLAAACWGNGDDQAAAIIDLLVAAGADVRRRDDAGWSLLHAAAMPYSHGAGYESSDGPDIGAIRAIVRHGLDVDTAGPGETTALMLVAEDGSAEAVAALLDLGADPRLRNTDGITPRQLAERSAQRLRAVADAADPEHRPAVAAAIERADAVVALLPT